MNTIKNPCTILLTGAAGHIATAFRRACNPCYRFRLADKHIELLQNEHLPTHELVSLDVADLAACQAACQGIDVVLHLAADPNPHADFYDSLLDANIKGAYNIFRAAKDQGCQRVVFASSAQAIEAYPLDQQVATTMSVRPKNMYGVTKCFGEAVAAYFAYCEGLSSIVVRIGNYNDFAPGQTHTTRDMSAYLSPSDMVQLVTQCIETPDILFALVHGVSDNRFKRLDLTDTRTLLSYHPRDDAFKILGIL
ncbi:MAG: NAD(P)-dependent oxidoreductase [Chloroflexales bacterium]|nr:NAD(P)-dependent oxidoreductase [Chloroflexales bacterium]